jgi:hypothetical protein
MVFVAADSDEEDPDRIVFFKADDPTENQVREALLSTAPIHYGAHFSLSGPGSRQLLAVCTSGPTAEANDPGEFLVYVDGTLVTERASRHVVLERFLCVLRA